MIKINEFKKDSLIEECISIVHKRAAQSYMEEVYFNALSEGIYIPKKALQQAVKNGPSNTEEEAYSLFLTTLYTEDELPDDDTYALIKDSITVIDDSVAGNDPYLRDVNIGELDLSTENAKFTVMPTLPYELQQLRIISNLFSPYELNTTQPFGFSKTQSSFPLLILNDTTGYGASTFVRNLSKEHIDKAKGHVVVFGLDIGYFAYLTALKNNVKSLTIVEPNEQLVRIFNKYILPKFKDDAKKKISIVSREFDETFLDKKFMNKFNFCFVNTYFTRDDGIPTFIKYKENEKDLKCIVSYWLEDDFISAYQDELFFKITNILMPDMPTELFLHEPLLQKKLDKYFEDNNYTIKNKMDLYSLIFDKSIMNDILDIPLNICD